MSNSAFHGFRNLTRFSGRDTRRQFWLHAGRVFVASMAAGFVLMAIGMTVASATMSDFAATVAMIGFPILMHQGMEGEVGLELFGPLFVNNMIYMAAVISLIIVLALPGTPGANRYGEPPAA